MAFKPRAMGIDRGGNELTADEWNTDTSLKMGRGLGETRARSPCLKLEEEEGDGRRSLEKLLAPRKKMK